MTIRFTRLLLVLGLLGAALLVAFVVRHWDYYSLAIDARLAHPRHDDLRSSGRIGLVCGVAGTSLMFLNLLYLARKRLAALEVLGPLRAWMGMHVLTGLTAASLIAVHSAFLPRSPQASLAFAALLVVAGTGAIGRYLYGRVPRSLEGRELGIDEIRRRLEAHRAELKALGAETVVFASERRRGVDPLETKGTLSTLRTLLFGDREARAQLAALRSAVLASEETRAAADRILPLVAQLCRERSWLLRYHELRALMRSWRFFHRWLAILMLLLAVFHIAVAVRYGDLWILRGGR
jgi:hypothetical protein